MKTSILMISLLSVFSINLKANDHLELTNGATDRVEEGYLERLKAFFKSADAEIQGHLLDYKVDFQKLGNAAKPVPEDNKNCEWLSSTLGKKSWFSKSKSVLLDAGLDAVKLIAFDTEWKKYQTEKCEASWFAYFTKKKCLARTAEVSAVIHNCVREKVAQDPSQADALIKAGLMPKDEPKPLPEIPSGIEDPSAQPQEKPAALPSEVTSIAEMEKMAKTCLQDKNRKFSVVDLAGLQELNCEQIMWKHMQSVSESCKKADLSDLTVVQPSGILEIECAKLHEVVLEKIATTCAQNEDETLYTYIDQYERKVSKTCKHLRVDFETWKGKKLPK